MPLPELQVAHGRELPATGHMDGLREQLSAKGIPGEAAELIIHSWRTKTNTNYNSAWKKWAHWCHGRRENPFSAPISSCLGFLAHQFSLGRKYRSLNLYRSAISSTHLPVEGPVGQHPLVARLLKGAFNSRPPKPRYSSVWDVSQVTDFLKAMGEPSSLPTPLLTKKLAMLLALVSVQRSSDLVRLSLPVTTTDDRVIIPVKGLAKQSAPGTARGRDPLSVLEFTQDETLCPVRCLKEYLARTEAWRKEQPQLFLATVAPHGPVSSSTIARWLKDVLRLSGVDTSCFSGHSTRSASTSAAALSGMTTAGIMQRAGWSQRNTFARFYHKPTDGESNAAQFSSAILTGKGYKHAYNGHVDRPESSEI